MPEKTRGIVLRTVKYGETSLIVSVFTEQSGLQSYMVKGVRSMQSRRSKASLLFPSSQLEMVVYHNPQKNLQFIKEYQPDYFYQEVGENIIKNGIAVFAVELLLQLVVTDDVHSTLFSFAKDFLIHLDQCDPGRLANLPLFFLIQSGRLSGYHLSGHFSETTPYLDLSEGRFTEHAAFYPPFTTAEEAELMGRLIAAESFEMVQQIKINNLLRKEILNHFLAFLQTHIPHFRELKSIAVLSAILN
jgi:DNA repair protein RecO (recombination protein O)